MVIVLFGLFLIPLQLLYYNYIILFLTHNISID